MTLRFRRSQLHCQDSSCCLAVTPRRAVPLPWDSPAREGPGQCKNVSSQKFARHVVGFRTVLGGADHPGRLQRPENPDAPGAWVIWKVQPPPRICGRQNPGPTVGYQLVATSLVVSCQRAPLPSTTESPDWGKDPTVPQSNPRPHSIKPPLCLGDDSSRVAQRFYRQ